MKNDLWTRCNGGKGGKKEDVSRTWKYRADFKRHNETIKRYNEIAVDALSDADCRINELFDYTLSLSDDCRSDMTHFNTRPGIVAMGNRVLSVICDELDIAANEIKIENFVPENYSDKNIGC